MLTTPDLAGCICRQLPRDPHLARMALDALGLHYHALSHYADEATQLCFLQWLL